MLLDFYFFLTETEPELHMKFRIQTYFGFMQWCNDALCLALYLFCSLNGDNNILHFIFFFHDTKTQADVIMKQYITATRSYVCAWLRTDQLYVKLEMLFPACITLSLYLDWISCAILSVSHSPSAIFHGQSLSLLSWITKVQYSFMALSFRDHFWGSLEACLKSWNCLNGQKTLGIGNIESDMWERVVFECCDCTQWHSAFSCSAPFCISFFSFFVFTLSVSPCWALALGFANLSATSMHRIVLSKETENFSGG